MKKLIYILLSVLTISCSEDSVNEIEHDYNFNSKELELIDKINDHRFTNNLSAFNLLPHLGYLSYKNNLEMFNIGSICNCYLNQSATSIKKLYNTEHVSQITMVNYSNTQNAFNAILSDNKCKNMVESDYTHIGVSILEDTITNKKYYTILIIKKPLI